MLKELNGAVGSIFTATSSAFAALDDGAKILRLKGVAAKQVAALEAASAIEAAKQNCSSEQLEAAAELLDMVD